MAIGSRVRGLVASLRGTVEDASPRTDPGSSGAERDWFIVDTRDHGRIQVARGWLTGVVSLRMQNDINGVVLLDRNQAEELIAALNAVTYRGT